MTTLEKFCLRWDYFQENVNTAFEDLRKDTDFTDVTLACEDGHQVEAHKVILSAASPFFRNLLKRNKHAHPLMNMRRMKSEDLLAIVDFLYYGEANIYQYNLDTFLNIAEELQLKGLNGTEGGGTEGEKDAKNSLNQSANTPVSSTCIQRKNNQFRGEIAPEKNSYATLTTSEDQINFTTAVALPTLKFSGDMKELDEQIHSMMGRSENMIHQGTKRMIKAYVCQICGKEGQQNHIKDHIEAKHLDGIFIPCSLCETTFRSRDSLRHHISRHNRVNN